MAKSHHVLVLGVLAASRANSINHRLITMIAGQSTTVLDTQAEGRRPLLYI